MNAGFYIPKENTLSKTAKLFWQVIRNNLSGNERIIPKGAVEFILNFSPETAFHSEPCNFGLSLPKCFTHDYHSGTVKLVLSATQPLLGALF